MAKKQIYFEVKFNIEEYLNCQFNIEKYEFLIKGIEANNLIIDPLYFFNLLYNDFHFFLDNKENYLTIKEYFVKPDLEGWFKHFYFLSLTDLIEETFLIEDLKNGVLSMSYKFLQDQHTLIFDKIKPKYDPMFENQFWFDFTEIKQYLKTLPDNISKKEYLLELKADNLQISVANREWLPENYRTFPEKCNFELEKINALIELEPTKPSKIKPSINDLSAFEIALRHWYLVKNRVEEYIKPIQVGQKYRHLKSCDNIEKYYSSIDTGKKSGNKSQLQNIVESLLEYPEVQKVVLNDLSKLS